MSKSTAKKIDNGKDNAVNLNNPNCSTYGLHKKNNPACKACLKNFDKRYNACIELSKKAVEKKTVKKITGMSLDCFNFRVDSDTHKFVNAIAKTAITMKAVKAMSWNTRPNTFYCAFGKLEKQGFAKKDKKSKTLILTAKGFKKLESWKSSRKAELKKVA